MCWWVSVVNDFVKSENRALLVFSVKASKIFSCYYFLLECFTCEAYLWCSCGRDTDYIIRVIDSAKYLKIHFVHLVVWGITCSNFALWSCSWCSWARASDVTIAHLWHRSPRIDGGWGPHVVWTDWSVHAIFVISGNEIEIRLSKGTVHVPFLLHFQVRTGALTAIQVVVLWTIYGSYFGYRWMWRLWTTQWGLASVCVERVIPVSFERLRRASHWLVPPWLCFFLFGRAHNTWFSVLVSDYGWSFDSTTYCDTRRNSVMLAFPFNSLELIL